jgi:hypothetical protein
MSERLYLNNKLVPLGIKPVTRKIRIADVGDVSARKSTFSYTIKIRRTTVTQQIFDMLGVQGNTSRKPFELLTCDYIVEGVPLISNGFAKIKSTSQFYEVNIFDGVKSLSELLKNKKLSDLPLDDLNHILTSQEYIDSYSNTEGFIYCIADYGLGVTTNLKVEKQAPSIFTHTLFRKIFESNGLNLIGEFFTTNNEYLNEVIPPSKGYLVEDTAFTSTAKGGADSDMLSQYQSSDTFFFFTEKFTFTNIGLVGASIVGGDIKFSIAGTYKLEIEVSSNLFETVASVYFNVNDVLRSTIWIEEGNNTKTVSIVFNVEVDDVVSLGVNSSSGYEPNELGKYTLNYTISCDTLLYLQTGGQLITPSDYIGEMNQLELVTDVINRYGLILKPIQGSSDYEFKRLEVLLNDTANAEDWTKKVSRTGKESYISGYAKTNKASFQYPEEIVIPNNDGEMLIDNENAANEKPFITSPFQIPNTAGTLSAETVYSVPVWELKDAVVENRETPLKVMKLNRIDTNITAKLFDEVTGVNASEGIPFLSLNNVSMNYVVNNFYKALRSLINNYRKVPFTMNLSLIDIFNLDFFKLKYLKQTGRYYYLNDVTHTPNKLSKVVMIEIAEFPTNQPPSQIGDYSFNMNHGTTRTITLNNLLTGYEDPEEDAALKIKIISGFDNDLIMKQGGVTLVAETEINVEDLDLTVFDSVGGTEGYSIEYEFTIADAGSGQYSEHIGKLTANVLSFVNNPPIADAGSDVSEEQNPPEVPFPNLIQLNGSASFDLTGEIVSYLWEIQTKPVLSNASINTQDTATPTASFEAPYEADSIGAYVLKLTVTDEFGATGTDTMNINITIFHP